MAKMADKTTGKKVDNKIKKNKKASSKKGLLTKFRIFCNF